MRKHWSDCSSFIQQFRGQTFVIKYGGSAMEDEYLVERTMRDIVFLEAVGIRPVVVHGGGKAITSRMREAGIKAQFVNGSARHRCRVDGYRRDNA